MSETINEQDQEIAAIATISAALARLDAEEARRRVISYVLARYMPAGALSPLVVERASQPTATIPNALVSFSAQPAVHEIPGIARLTESGDLYLTVRDLKARSGLDAAVRLAHVAIYAYRQLTGQPLSSSKGLTPILKSWRIYDGNSRTRLAREKGIIRSGDDLSLDAHATRDAERFVQEILDVNIEGKWKPK